MDKLSYALGLSMANNFLGSGIQELNIEDFAEGLRAVYEGKDKLMTFDEAKKVVTNFFTELESKGSEMNEKLGREFLENNAKQEGIHVTASGLQYQIIKEGTGITPKASDKVQVHYVGSLLDGNEFDNSIKRGEPLEFPVNAVIEGWQDLLQVMKEGMKVKAWIPSALAYGEAGVPPMIPANALLVFEVELLKV